MRLRRGLWVLALGSSLLAGCQKPIPASVLQLATDVKVGQPVVQDVTDYEEFTGHTEAIYSVQVTSRVTGYLTKRYFVEGSEVKKGDVLYEIDNRPYKAALDLARAYVARSQAHLRRLDADRRRASNLFQRAAIGKAEFDIVTSDFGEAQAMLNAAQAQLQEAELNFGFTTIRAEMGGQISRSLVEPGNLVRQETTLLTDIVDPKTLYVYFDLNEETLSRVRNLIETGRVSSVDGKQVRVEVGLSDEEGYSFKDALVNFSENKLDAATGTLRIRGVIENTEPLMLNPGFSVRIRPGLFVRVRLPIGSAHPTLLIPEAAVGSDQGRSFVYIVGPLDEVIYRPVEIGQKYEGLRAVVQGLSKDERIVVDGLQRVRPGSKVRPGGPDSKKGTIPAKA
jgi:RND family efflux transporter MFP subunit